MIWILWALALLVCVVFSVALLLLRRGRNFIRQHVSGLLEEMKRWQPEECYSGRHERHFTQAWQELSKLQEVYPKPLSFLDLPQTLAEEYRSCLDREIEYLMEHADI